MDEIYQRTELVIGKENMTVLKQANVCICGIGGVGSYVLEALARVGIGKITIIDKDNVDATNINRQLIAMVDNVGNAKVIEAKKRINSINSAIQITDIKDFIDGNNVDKYITPSFDYVIDAIDNVESKIAIITACKKNNIRVISCMGMANRLQPLKIKVTDISKTEVCPLAKVVRKRLKEEKVQKVKVVFSDEKPLKAKGGQLGSISYVPATAGLIIASEVVKDIIT